MAKENNGNRFWLKLTISIGIVLLAAAVGYGVLNQKVTHNCDTIKVHGEQLKVHEKAVNEQRQDIKYIKETVDRIERKLEDG